MPRVSVIIPTYNCAQYIGVAVESVLAQTFADYELIVVDDGSTDETADTLKPYEGRITLIHQENQERSAARNTGIRASSGQYIAFLDSDDIWQPNKLKRQVAILDQYPEVVLTYCQALYVDIDGRPVEFVGETASGESGSEIIVADLSRNLLLGNVISGGGSTPMVRRAALEEVGLFDEILSYAEDWDMWMRLSRKGPFAYVPEPLACYRVYGWRKVLGHESSDALTTQHERVIEKALAGWQGDPNEVDTLRSSALATIYTRAFLANYQLGHPRHGRANLEQAMRADPGLMNKDRLIQLAVDRAKLIETESGSYKDAEAFIHMFFSNLPAEVSHFASASREAIGWLYIAGAFERYQNNEMAGLRRLLMQGIILAPASLKNAGVLSITLEALLGKPVARSIRRLARNVTGRWERTPRVAR